MSTLYDFIRSLSPEAQAAIQMKAETFRMEIEADTGIQVTDSELRGYLEDVCFDYGLFAELDEE